MSYEFKMVCSNWLVYRYGSRLVFEKYSVRNSTGTPAILTEVFVVFLSPSRKMPEYHPSIRPQPLAFQFVILPDAIQYRYWKRSKESEGKREGIWQERTTACFSHPDTFLEEVRNSTQNRSLLSNLQADIPTQKWLNTNAGMPTIWPRLWPNWNMPRASGPEKVSSFLCLFVWISYQVRAEFWMKAVEMFTLFYDMRKVAVLHNLVFKKKKKNVKTM
jgi:hypothetical protein